LAGLKNQSLKIQKNVIPIATLCFFLISSETTGEETPEKTGLLKDCNSETIN